MIRIFCGNREIKNPLNGGFVNVEHTMPIVGKIIPIFFENSKHPAVIFVE